MNNTDILILVIVGIAAAALVIFLAWKNQKDKKELNPDAPDLTEEIRMDQERKELKR